jgi:DNA-directed RNA polymerase specialized sigma24 family protein
MQSDGATQQRGKFPTTGWRTIFSAGQEDSEAGRAALDRLLQRYEPHVLGWIRAQFPTHRSQAEDWYHDFILDRVLEKNLLATADPMKGRFRNLLLASLKRFVLNRIRDKNRAKRCASEGEISLDAIKNEFELADASRDVDLEFDRKWAIAVMKECVERLNEALRKDGREDLFFIFETRFRAPLLDGAEPVPYEDIAERFSIASPLKAANLFTTVKRRFRKAMNETLGGYGYEGEELKNAENELIELLIANIK